jgi:hypothetical protein
MQSNFFEKNLKPSIPSWPLSSLPRAGMFARVETLLPGDDKPSAWPCRLTVPDIRGRSILAASFPVLEARNLPGAFASLSCACGMLPRRGGEGVEG